ncbi:MAG TPA: hypothetical protein VLM89_10530 [Phycisphaerae bacterium]|nr:hypothetical protein [Phycisphaerae bacterium]
MRLSYATILLLTTAGLLVGCQAPPQPGGPTVDRAPTVTAEDRERLFEAACDTLRGSLFRLDRQDKVNGVIITFPETTSQWFEFWRPQPRTAYYWWEANRQTIQRQVTVELKPADRADETSIDVRVDRLRYRLEERQIDNAAAAMRLFSADAPVESGRLEKPSKTGQWIPLGRDGRMETSLLSAILANYQKHLGSGISNEPPAATQAADTP